MKILVTAGGTREPIDRVRFLANGSTGATGAALAEALVARGHAVHLLRGVGAVAPVRELPGGRFTSAEDLGKQLRAQLADGSLDAVIMAAAVADYRPETKLPGKWDSSAESLTLRLVRTPKLLPQLRGFSPLPLRVIGFKLTVGADAAARRAAVERQFAAGGVDVVVHNDLDEIASAAMHPFRCFTAAEAEPAVLTGVPALAEALGRLLEAAP